MTTKKRKKDPNDDEKVKFCFKGSVHIHTKGCLFYIYSKFFRIYPSDI